MNTRGAYLFFAMLAVVIAALVSVWVGGSPAPASAVPVVTTPPGPAAPTPVPAGDPLPADAVTPSPQDGLRVQPIASEAEREQTLAQRRAALPVFLKAADESIAKLQADIAQARDAGADEAEVATLQARLEAMHRVRDEVLARNADIRG